MFQRLVEISLIVAIAIGGVMLWRSSAQRSSLRQEHDRLVQKIGQLPIKDETKIHVMAIETGEPLHYAWRMYLPPNHQFAYTSKSGSGSGSMSSSWEGIVRIRMREVNGQVMLYDKMPQGSGLQGYGSDSINTLFKDPGAFERQLHIERLGARGLEVFDPQEVKTLIKLSLLESEAAEIKKQVKHWEYHRLTPHIEWIRIGPPGFENQP